MKLFQLIFRSKVDISQDTIDVDGAQIFYQVLI